MNLYHEGDTSLCELCKNPIIFTNGMWRHIGASYRHMAIPTIVTSHEPIEQFKQGQIVRIFIDNNTPAVYGIVEQVGNIKVRVYTGVEHLTRLPSDLQIMDMTNAPILGVTHHE